MYFNIVHGTRRRRRLTTAKCDKPSEDFLLVARDITPQGMIKEREIALFDLTPSASDQ
jgi:hypothetical protein